MVVIRAISEALIALAQLSDARHEELLNASHRSRLLIANEMLRKSSPLLVSALRTFLQNPGNAQALASRDYAITQLLTATQDIMVVIGSTDLDDNTFLEAPGAVAAAYEATQAQLLGAMAALDVVAIEDSVAKILANSMAVATDCRDRVRAADILRCCQDVRATLDQLSARPASARAEELADELRTVLAALDQTVKTSILDEVTDAFIRSEPPVALDSLMASARTPASSLEPDVAAFQQLTTRLITSARQIAATSMDAKRVRMVEVTAEQLEACSAQVVNAAQIVRANPESKATQDHLALLKSNWQHRVELLRATIAGMTAAADVVDVDADAIARHMVQAQTAASASNAGVGCPRKSACLCLPWSCVAVLLRASHSLVVSHPVGAAGDARGVGEPRAARHCPRVRRG